MERASGGVAGLEAGGRKWVSPSSAAGTRSAVAGRDSSAEEEGSSAGEADNSAVEGGRTAGEADNSDAAVRKGSLESELGLGLGSRLGLGVLPGAESSVCRAAAHRTSSGLREETSEVAGSSSAGLFVFM